MDLSNSAITKIGNIIRSNKRNTAEYARAITTLNLWRESHGVVMDYYYDKCVELAAKIDKNIIVAQRLKRLPTIIGKLNRFKTMRLSSMHDIAGVRIIAEDISQLELIERHIKRWKNLIDVDDYIKQPRDSGYRSKHFIFKKDGMLVEIQLRTQIQHLWATAVETIDVFRGASLKEHDDNSYWHDFFCQVSSIFAIAEGKPTVKIYNEMTINEIFKILASNMEKNSIHSKIIAFAMTDPIVNIKSSKKSYYLVVQLDFAKKEVYIKEFREEEYEKAFDEYQNLERQNSNSKFSLLIATNQIKKIQEIYPNYFMNLTNFIDTINYTLAKGAKK